MDESIWPPGTIPEYIVERGFDPETLMTSHWVDGVLFSSYIGVYGVPYSRVDFAEAVELPVDSVNYSDRDRPVAETAWSPGEYCQGLTQDDAGGLRYLLASNNVNFEILLADVRGAGIDAASFVNGALRPGIEKLTFVRQDYDSALGRTTPIPNEFTDTYFTNGMATHQQLRRVITEPDFLFCAANTGDYSYWVPLYGCTGTTNWWNSALFPGGSNNGPGVIRPPVRIIFRENSFYVGTTDYYPLFGTGSASWSSFEDTTNAPIAYPCPTAPPETPMIVRLHLETQRVYPSSYIANYEWQLPLPLGGQVAMQYSTNLNDWVSCGVVTNQGIRVEWSHQVASGA